MKPGTRLLLSVVLGLLATVLVGMFMFSIARSNESERQQMLADYGGEIVQIAVAARDLSPGATITAADVRMEEWAAGLLPGRAYTKQEDVIGTGVSSRILEGEPILEERTGVSSSARLEPSAGHAAVGLPVQTVTAVGGAVTPGDLVDIYVSTSEDATLLIQDALIMSTSAVTGTTEEGDAFSESATSMVWIVVEVPEEIAGSLIRGVGIGQIYLALPHRSGESTTAP